MTELANPFGCENQKDLEIKESSGFFQPEAGTYKIRFLAGPIVYYESQEFKDGSPVGDRRYYAEDDINVKKDKHAKLTLAYIIYDYDDNAIKQWTISSVPVLKQIRDVDDANEDSDLSAYDCKFKKTKKGKSKYFEYNLVGGQNSTFTNKDIIQEFIDEKPFDTLCDKIQEKIDDTNAGLAFEKGSVEEEKTIDKQIKEAEKPDTVEETKEVFK